MVLGLSESPETYARRTERLKESCRFYVTLAHDALGYGDYDMYREHLRNALQAGEILLEHLRGRRPAA